MDDDGVWDFLPTGFEAEELKIYQEEEFRRWLNIFRNEESKDWIIYKKKFYRFFSMAGHRIIAKQIKDKVKPGQVTLELGAGTGALLEVTSEKNVIAVDLSKPSLALLKKKWPEATCICASMTALPLRSDSMSKIVTIHTLEHVYQIGEALEEICRVLRKDGGLYYAIPTEGGLAFWLGRWLVTRPHLKKKYGLDAAYIMDREHINDGARVIKFLKMYFSEVRKSYWPLSQLPFLSMNALIYGVARKPKK